MNTKIDVGSIVMAKVVDMNENKRDVRRRRVIKEVMVYVKAVVGNKKLLFKFEGG